MSRLELFFTVLVVLSLFTGGSARYWKQGCNGEEHGITCCYKGFTSGDNENPDGERFIQANEYNQGCFQTCKKLHPDSTGITESVIQKYQSGNGKGMNKCWCELGVTTKLNADNTNYQTCVFTIPGALSPPNSQATSECLSVGGSFFGRQGGMFKALPNFKTSQNFRINLSIKPQNITGMLVGMRGEWGYLLLELVNGEVRFRVESPYYCVDQGEDSIKMNSFATSFKPRTPLDDGNYHEISARKSGMRITLMVDKQLSAPSYGVGIFKNTTSASNTGSPLFIGGHINPNLFPEYPGSYQGCFKDVFINANKVEITRDLVYGDVALGPMEDGVVSL